MNTCVLISLDSLVVMYWGYYLLLKIRKAFGIFQEEDRYSWRDVCAYMIAVVECITILVRDISKQ